MTVTPFNGNGAELMFFKYQSSLIAQHLFRKEVMKFSQPKLFLREFNLRDQNEKPVNPFWHIGEFAHRHSSGQGLQLPTQITEQLERQMSLDEQMEKMSLPWYWLGWMAEPAFIYTNCENSCAEPLAKLLMKDSELNGGYLIHSIFMIMKMNIEMNFGLYGHQKGEIKMDFSNVLVNGADDNRKQIFTLITENSYRVFLHLILEKIESEAALLTPEQISNWNESVREAEAHFDHFRSEFYDYNIDLLNQVRDYL